MDNTVLEKNHVFKQLIKPLERREFMDALVTIQAYAEVNG
jgi:hypothetical protein